MDREVELEIVTTLAAMVALAAIYALIRHERRKRFTLRNRKLRSVQKANHQELPDDDTYADYRVLRKLNPSPQYGEYIRFTNLVLESGYNTPYTEIDELIVSRFGIFCIEQKDYKGVILGKTHDQSWTQCMRNYRGTFMNPGRQNYKHLKALERLLGDKLRAGIHTYSYFPKSYKVITDDKKLFTSHQEMWDEIRSHTKPVYSFEQTKEIAHLLAHESTRKEIRSIIHVATLKSHLASAKAK